MTDNDAGAASPTTLANVRRHSWRPTSLTLASLAPQLLRTRLALTYAGLAVLVMVVLGWSLAATVKGFSVAQLSADLTQRTVVAADILAPFLNQSAASQDLPSEVGKLARTLDAHITVVAPDGSVLGDSATTTGTAVNQSGRPEIRDAMSSGSGISQRVGGGSDEPYLYAASRIGDSQAVVRLGIPLWPRRY
jgi:two-component system phosphate regulon sensor histidine kinase PhoR